MIRDDRQKDGSQEGAALIGTVMVMLILSMLGTVSMNLAALEIESVGAARDEAVARHLAEAGADLAVQWFHDPQSAPIGTDGSLLGKRYELRHSGPSFFDAQGVSQFVGTADHPDRGGQQSRRTERPPVHRRRTGDRKSTRLNSSHRTISYAVFCLNKKTNQ